MDNLIQNNNALSTCDNVLNFYSLTVQLKELIRSGWKLWNVERERLESDAEHIFSVMMLAIAMKSEFKYDVDIYKVILMLAIHETEEIIIGDQTPFSKMSASEKLESGHKAVREIFSLLIDGEEYCSLIEEFDARETPEAQFAYQCDKLDADLMAIRYDREKAVTYENASDVIKSSEQLKWFVAHGAKNMSEFFCYYDMSKYDDNFKAVLNREFSKDKHDIY